MDGASPNAAALAAATTALNLYNNQKEISDAASALASGDVSKAASISISLGSSKSQNNSSSASDSARGSSITAGGDVTISALGAGQASNITVQGSTITAGNNAKLLADNEIRLLAAKNDYTQTSSNSSSSGSIGFSIGAETGVTFSASKARGNSDGTDTSYTNTRIQAGKTASLTSGGDTTLKGAVVTGNQVKADVGGNLNIQSLQDTSTFTGQQSSSGASITIGPAFIPTGGGFSA
ncbi:MAG: hemagglutinin repeat-containing protein, partial [Polaromonas sp.]|nr:hemagglutinin repeat-containing protein [Polaromonas sp.]